MSEVSYITLVTLVIATLSPLILQRFPASWTGEKMAAIALGISAALGIGDLAVTGQLAHFNGAAASLTLLAYIGATQGFYALFKDRWKLADPPVPVTPAKVA